MSAGESSRKLGKFTARQTGGIIEGFAGGLLAFFIGVAAGLILCGWVSLIEFLVNR